MNLPKYDVVSSTSYSYEFISEGRNGKIYKSVSFQETNIEGVYNLGLVDKNPITGEVDDKVVSNNGDRDKVLSTVVDIIYLFTDEFPNAWIYAEGSTPARTRLYQMSIVKYFDIVQRDFELQALFENEWEEFRLNVNYQAFVIKRKKH